MKNSTLVKLIAIGISLGMLFKAFPEIMILITVTIGIFFGIVYLIFCVLDYNEETDEDEKEVLLGALYDKSVTLYQDCKYILEAISAIRDCNEFGYIRASVAVIRTNINTEMGIM